MPKTTDGLTPKQERFVLEYLKDLNAKQAAIRAGYSAKSAEQQGSTLLADPKVSVVIRTRLEASTAKATLTVERLDQEIARLAYADLRKLYDADGRLLSPHEWPDDVAAAVAGTETVEEREDGKVVGYVKKLKTWDKVSALTLAARRLKALTDRVEVDVPDDLAGRVARAAAKVNE